MTSRGTRSRVAIMGANIAMPVQQAYIPVESWTGRAKKKKQPMILQQGNGTGEAAMTCRDCIRKNKCPERSRNYPCREFESKEGISYEAVSDTASHDTADAGYLGDSGGVYKS